MAHHRNADVDQAAHDVNHRAPAFDFHRAGSALLKKSACVAYGVGHTDLVRQEGHVGHDESPLGATSHCLRVMNHGLQRHRQCVLVP
jgi:hypothetical protein